MAKELPYFKFEPNQWENGNIQIVSREEKGLFIDLCSMYWSRLGDLPFKLAVQKLCGGNAPAFNSLIENDIFTVIDGEICIDFLNEQLLEFENTSQQNSKNAKEGWEKRKANKPISDRNATASKPQCENDAIREDKSKENKIKEEKTFYRKFAHLSVTYEDFELLKKEFSEADILDCFDRIENYKENTKYKSLYLTSKQWLKKQKEDKLKNPDNGKPTYIKKPTYRNSLQQAINNNEQTEFGSSERELSEDTEFEFVE